jgi:hypothetical protein
LASLKMLIRCLPLRVVSSRVGREKRGTYSADYLPGLVDYRYRLHDRHFAASEPPSLGIMENI